MVLKNCLPKKLPKLNGITIPEENVNILVSQMETATGELIKLEEIISEEVPLFMPPLLSKVQKPDEG